QVLPGLVRRPWRDLAAAVGALDERPPDDELHRVRILAKRVRYAGEAVAPAIGPPAARFAKLAAALPTVLGGHPDSVTMQGGRRGGGGAAPSGPASCARWRPSGRRRRAAPGRPPGTTCRANARERG